MVDMDTQLVDTPSCFLHCYYHHPHGRNSVGLYSARKSYPLYSFRVFLSGFRLRPPTFIENSNNHNLVARSLHFLRSFWYRLRFICHFCDRSKAGVRFRCRSRSTHILTHLPTGGPARGLPWKQTGETGGYALVDGGERHRRHKTSR